MRLLWFFAPVWLTAPWAALRRPARRAWYARLVRALERCGATFIKLGQIISTRPDLVPPDLCQALSKLHDQAPVTPFTATRTTVEAAFAEPLDRVFRSFSPEPIASGSIAQVHRATLRDGTAVAVKVRHPGAAAAIFTDLRIIVAAAAMFDKLPGARWLSLPESAREFAATMRGQLDLRREAEHLRRFAANFAGVFGVHFPQPLFPWVHETVIVESFEAGEPIRHFVARREPVNAELARRGLEVFMHMIFAHGFVHADLHPGNILVRVVDGHAHVVILDCGMVAEIRDDHRANFAAFFAAIASGDGRAAARLMIDNAPHHECDDAAAFAADIDAIYAPVRQANLADIEIAAIISQVMVALRRHRVKMEHAFTSINVGMMVLEGLGRQLDPHLNLLETAAPFLLQMTAAANDERNSA